MDHAPEVGFKALDAGLNEAAERLRIISVRPAALIYAGTMLNPHISRAPSYEMRFGIIQTPCARRRWPRTSGD